MKNKNFLSVLLALTLTLTAIPATAFASDINRTVPVDLTVEAPIFSVTVPTSLPITITETGEVVVATTAAIINGSAGPIKITGIQTKGINGWSTTDFDDLDIKSAKMGSKNVGFAFNIGNTDIRTIGPDLNDFIGSIGIAKGQSMPLIYDAKVPAQKTAQTGVQIAEVIITVGWDD